MFQHNDDPEVWADLKRKEVEYERRKAKRVQYFESVRTAQTVQIEDIPLPDATSIPAPKMPADFHPQIAPPNMRPPISALPPGLQRHDTMADTAEPKQKEDPGVPPFVPPNLFIMRELDSDYESDPDADDGSEEQTRSDSVDKSSNESDDADDDDRMEGSVPKPTSVQQRILAIAGQKYDDFMKELENVHKKKDQERSRAAASHGDDNERNKNKSDDIRRGNEAGASSTFDVPPPPPRKDNPVMIPNNDAFPAPPMAPPPFNSKMPGLPPPPPPPMGMFSFDSVREMRTNDLFTKNCVVFSGMPMMFRPPMRPNLPMGMRMPNMVPRLRMPPAPPPGLPNPRLMHPHKQFNQQVSIQTTSTFCHIFLEE